MDRQEDCRLIAEFMGEKLPYKNEQNEWEFYVQGAGKVSSTNIEDLFRFMGYNYHNDWNWLMEVVEKIESLGVVVEIRDNVCYIETTPIDYYSELEETKIQATYKAVVEFIKWHNNQTN